MSSVIGKYKAVGAELAEALLSEESITREH